MDEAAAALSGQQGAAQALSNVTGRSGSGPAPKITPRSTCSHYRDVHNQLLPFDRLGTPYFNRTTPPHHYCEQLIGQSPQGDFQAIDMG